MQINALRPRTSSRKARRIGRGGKRGTYSGRGIKGLGARAGGKFRPAERDILKKIPKLRGWSFKSFRRRPAAVNLDMIEKRFSEGETVSPEALLKKRIIKRIGGKMPQVKILGRGELKKKILFKDVLFSKPAADKI